MATLYSDVGNIVSKARGYSLFYTNTENAMHLIKSIL